MGELRGDVVVRFNRGYSGRQFGGLILFSALVAGSVLSAKENKSEPKSVKVVKAPIEIDPESFKVPSSYGELPALWHLKITGADWAKWEIQKYNYSYAKVVVFDDRVNDAIPIELPKRTPKTVKLALTQSVDQKNIPVNSTAEGVLRGLHALFNLPEMEILDPREMELAKHGEHGNHVAGTIGHQNPVFGVSPAADVYSLPAFEGPIYTQIEDTIRNLTQYAESENDPIVINMSLRFGFLPELKNAFDKLLNLPGAAMAAGAANDRSVIGPRYLIHHLPQPVVVGALAPIGELAFFSNYGPRLDILAPGIGILSRGNQVQSKEGHGLEVMEGTSMASPMVAGAMANMRSIRPRIKIDQMKKILFGTAWDLGVPGKDDRTGHGLLNILKATAVTIRLDILAGRNEEKFEELLNDPESFSLKELAANATLEKAEACVGCPSKMIATYRSALFSDKIEQLATFQKDPSVEGLLSFGVQHMAFNRPQAKLKPKALNAYTQNVLNVQNQILFNRANDWGVFESLANPNVILKLAPIYKGRKDLEKIFTTRMALVAPERLEELKLAMQPDEKKTEPSTPNPSAPAKMGPLLSPKS